MEYKNFKLLEFGPKFCDREKLMLKSIDKFYLSNKKYFNIILAVITGKTRISIRILDWFIITYSKEKDINYEIKINNRKSYFYIYDNYKNQLISYNKKYFDPFCRKRKILYKYDNIKLKTSIGQLNFFSWLIRYKIINYVDNNFAKLNKKIRESNRKRKIKEIIKPINLTCSSGKPNPEICSQDNVLSFVVKSNQKQRNIQKKKRSNLINRIRHISD